MSRLYVPTTVAGLRAAHEQARIEPGPDLVVLEVGDDGDEEAEYDALMRAADASAALLEGPGRRVVVVAEVPDPSVGSDGSDPTYPVPWKRVVAVHADPVDRPVDADPDEDLAWYATQEIPDLI